MMDTLYLRLERTRDNLAKDKSFTDKERDILSQQKDVVAYLDKDCQNEAAVWVWWRSKPTKKTRTVVLNCQTYKCEWVE